MKLIKIAVLVVFIGIYHGINALEKDSEEAVYIDSNVATFDDKTGISTYAGNVVTVQGNLKINSDKLVVYLEKNNIEKLVFTGKPMKFRQQLKKGKDEILGQALVGEYYPKKNQLLLIGNAMVSQGSNQSTSELISYDSKNLLIQAGERYSKSKRVRSIFKPKAKQEK